MVWSGKVCSVFERDEGKRDFKQITEGKEMAGSGDLEVGYTVLIAQDAFFSYRPGR